MRSITSPQKGNEDIINPLHKSHTQSPLSTALRLFTNSSNTSASNHHQPITHLRIERSESTFPKQSRRNWIPSESSDGVSESINIHSSYSQESQSRNNWSSKRFLWIQLMKEDLSINSSKWSRLFIINTFIQWKGFSELFRSSWQSPANARFPRRMDSIRGNSEWRIESCNHPETRQID